MQITTSREIKVNFQDDLPKDTVIIVCDEGLHIIQGAYHQFTSKEEGVKNFVKNKFDEALAE